MLILLVDDDADDFGCFREALAESHPQARCLYACNGLAALDLLAELVVLPDYIFLDINMPLMNGRELMAKLKGHHGFKEIPVIIYSTTSNEAERVSFKELGAHHFLVKPAKFATLVDALKEIIK